MRDGEPTEWPACADAAERLARDGVFVECSGDTQETGAHNDCVGCPGWTTSTGDWCGAVYMPRKKP